MRAPGITFNISPLWINVAEMTFSEYDVPSLFKVNKIVSEGTSWSSLVTASEVFFFAEDSKYFPSKINVMSIELVSKNVFP